MKRIRPSNDDYTGSPLPVKRMAALGTLLALVGVVAIVNAQTDYDYVIADGDVLFAPPGVTYSTVVGEEATPSPTTTTPSPATPSPSAVSPSPSSAPPTSTPTPSPSPSDTPAPTPTPTATPTLSPTPTPLPTPTPSPTAPPTPPPAGDFIGPEVAGLPEAGSAWVRIVQDADASAGTANLTCDQNQRQHPKVALAAALVYAKTGTAAYKTKVITLVEQARASARDCGNAILSLGRQLSAYMLAADYVGYHDPAFEAWVRAVTVQDFPASHSRWYELRKTAENTSNNWGTFALASLTAADAYLRDEDELAQDSALWASYGNGTGSFQHTSGYNAIWSCPVGYEINPASCADERKEGAAVEDASRSCSNSSCSSFPSIANYPAEAAQGYVLTAELLAKAGYDGWGINDSQACRNGAWRQRGSNLNYSSADYHVTYVYNERCGTSYATPQPAVFGRGWGYTDWLYGP